MKRLKNLLLGIALVSLSGIGHFFSNSKSMPLVEASASNYVIENDNLKVGINYDGCIHSIQTKKWNNPYHDKPIVLLSDPMNYRNCIETGYTEENLPNRNTNWVLKGKKSDNHIVLQSGTKHNVIREIIIEKDTINIIDKIPGYQGLVKHYSCIHNEGNDGSNYFIVNNDSAKEIIAQRHQKSLFNWKAFKQNVYIKQNSNSIFGLKTNDRFCVIVKNDNNTGEIVQFSDSVSTKIFCSEVLPGGSEIKTKIVISPATYESLKEHSAEKIINFGFFSFINRSLFVIVEKIMKHFQYNFLGFILCLIGFMFILSPMLYLNYKKTQDDKNIAMEMMKKMQSQTNGNLIWEISKPYIISLLKTILISFIIGYLSFFAMRFAIGECFYMKYCSFLWVKDLGGVDTGSVFNLYGFIPVELPGILQGIGVIKIWFWVILFRNLFSKFNEKKKEDSKDNNLFLTVILTLFFVSCFKNVASSLAYIFYIITSDLMTIFFAYIYNKNQKDYIQI